MKKYFFFLALLSFHFAKAQLRFSIASDVSVLRNFSPHQKFWALGQTILSDFHFKPKETGYISLAHYTTGSFKNGFTVPAKSSITVPSEYSYQLKSNWRYRKISLGWKHYFRGDFEQEQTWNLYGFAGFGLLFSKVQNSFDRAVDTSLYSIPKTPVPAASEFKRLTIDMGVGVEFPLGGDFYLYGNIKTWLATSDYPSPYLYNNNRVPMPVMINAGLRLFFDLYDY